MSSPNACGPEHALQRQEVRGADCALDGTAVAPRGGVVPRLLHSSLLSTPQHTLLNLIVTDYSGRIIYANVGRPGAMTDRSHYTDTPMWESPLDYFSVYSHEGAIIREFVLGDNIYKGAG